MKKYLRFIICIYKLVGTRNWYEGIDKPNIYQWIYRWRVSLGTAIKVSKIIWL